MVGAKRIDCRPRLAIVVGAGVVGLCTASDIHSYPGALQPRRRRMPRHKAGFGHAVLNALRP